MTITVFDGALPTSASLNQSASQKLTAALRAVADRVSRVDVRFRDDNARKGGIDKLCRISCQLNAVGTVVVESRHSDFYAALNLASERLRRAVMRRVLRARK